MNAIPVCMDEPAARARFEGRSWFQRIASRRSILRKVELLWIPAYRVQVVRDTNECVLVDGLTGDARIEDSRSIVDVSDAVSGFAPVLSEHDAALVARKTWIHAAMLHRRVTGSDDQPDHVVVPVLYPYWVAYIARGDSMSIRAIDAFTGERAGPKQQLALIEAFCELERTDTTGFPEHGALST